MRALPEGVTVYAGGHAYRGEVPDELHPDARRVPETPRKPRVVAPAAPEDGGGASA